MGSYLRWFAGGAMLLAQVGGIAYSRLVPERYFCWAPYDIHTKYVFETRIGGRPLSEEESYARYHIPRAGEDHRSPANVIDLLRRVERRHADRAVELVLRYQVNGGPEQIWRWPD
jgi:hypothetical protein